jgi:hypothetical protein
MVRNSTEKSKWWESDTVQVTVVLAAIFTIMVGTISILQFDWTPLSDSLNRTIPVYYLIFMTAFLFCLFFIADKLSNYYDAKPLKDAELLRYGCVRHVALLCRTPHPQPTNYVNEMYEIYCRKNPKAKFSSPQSCLQAMEKKGLIEYNVEKKYWTTTQKSIDYIAKYHSDEI